MNRIVARALSFALLASCGGGRAYVEPAPAPRTQTSTSSGDVVVETSAPRPVMQQSPFGECMGQWTGAGVQQGGQWRVDMAVTPPDQRGACGTIEYPSLGCGGYLLNCVASANGTVTFTEYYTHDAGHCARAGVITSTCSMGQMRWTWTGEGGPAMAVLSRP